MQSIEFIKADNDNVQVIEFFSYTAAKNKDAKEIPKLERVPRK